MGDPVDDNMVAVEVALMILKEVVTIMEPLNVVGILGFEDVDFLVSFSSGLKLTSQSSLWR